jgi:hypothetical protein
MSEARTMTRGLLGMKQGVTPSEVFRATVGGIYRGTLLTFPPPQVRVLATASRARVSAGAQTQLNLPAALFIEYGSGHPQTTIRLITSPPTTTATPS